MKHAARSLLPAATVGARAPVAVTSPAPRPRPQLLLPYADEVWTRTPRTPRPHRAPHAPAVLRVQLDLPFGPPRRRLTLLRAPAAPRRPHVQAGVGGPDPARPCDGCARRTTCRAPCALLARLVPGEDVTAWNEVGSRALMEGRGYDEQFMSQPEALAAEEPEDLWPEVVARYGGERLRATLGVLTPPQQEVISLYLGGMSRAEIGTGRATSRQATHKVFWAAIGRLATVLGPLPPRGTLAATTRGAGSG